jgi:SpoVK/Ycf46/Vps4 family AAA+-type ATPase
MRVGAPPWNAAAQSPHDDARVDLSAVASHHIGETEKHLARLFGDASASDPALGFDEADALFGRRTEVRDAHDRDATRAADDPL